MWLARPKEVRHIQTEYIVTNAMIVTKSLIHLQAFRLHHL